MKKTRKLQARILLCQEERIRLVDDKGQSYLFDVEHGVRMKRYTLTEWIRKRTKLDVTYEGESDSDTGVVRSIKKAA